MTNLKLTAFPEIFLNISWNIKTITFPRIISKIPRNPSEYFPRSLHSPHSVPRSCIPGFISSLFNSALKETWTLHHKHLRQVKLHSLCLHFLVSFIWGVCIYVWYFSDYLRFKQKVIQTKHKVAQKKDQKFIGPNEKYFLKIISQ